MNAEDVTLGGHWLLTPIMIVVVGWIVFKYLVPDSPHGGRRIYRSFA